MVQTLLSFPDGKSKEKRDPRIEMSPAGVMALSQGCSNQGSQPESMITTIRYRCTHDFDVSRSAESLRKFPDRN